MSNTIDSPDDIGGAGRAAQGTLSPVEGDIDWLRSTTTRRIQRTAVKPAEVDVEHVAYFGIRPETVMDMLARHSATVSFRPEFLTAEWRNGTLARVVLSGPQRLKSGGVSDKMTRDRRWSSGWTAGVRDAVDKSGLPAPVAEALSTYEGIIAVDRNGARK